MTRQRDRSTKCPNAVIGMDWLTAAKARLVFDEQGGDRLEHERDDAPGQRHNLGLRSQAIISGDRGRVGVARAGVSSGTPTTVISRRLANRIAREREPGRCTSAPWALTTFCGDTAPIDVAINECTGARVNAVVTDDLPRDVDLVVGRDALSPVREIQFGSMPPESICRRRRRGWL